MPVPSITVPPRSPDSVSPSPLIVVTRLEPERTESITTSPLVRDAVSTAYPAVRSVNTSTAAAVRSSEEETVTSAPLVEASARAPPEVTVTGLLSADCITTPESVSSTLPMAPLPAVPCLRVAANVASAVTTVWCPPPRVAVWLAAAVTVTSPAALNVTRSLVPCLSAYASDAAVAVVRLAPDVTNMSSPGLVATVATNAVPPTRASLATASPPADIIAAVAVSLASVVSCVWMLPPTSTLRPTPRPPWTTTAASSTVRASVPSVTVTVPPNCEGRSTARP
mmetsp:Transcript_27423/g.68675  ORF Transcript_27423/g.68675 Transcript_27423/m.68675 type:complete len:281 (-) Transcript_27423:901-1743(-)